MKFMIQNFGKNYYIVAMLFLTILVAGCVSSPPVEPTEPTAPQTPTAEPQQPEECKDKTCFITEANDCKNISIDITEELGVVRYSSENCTFTKTIVSLKENENADIVNLLKGKSLTCNYTKGQFDSMWVTSFVAGLENCEGELKDSIAALVIYT